MAALTVVGAVGGNVAAQSGVSPANLQKFSVRVGGVAGARRTLLQLDRPQPRAILDATADSLVAIVFSPALLPGTIDGGRALDLLIRAGMAPDGPASAPAYGGAVQRLARIAEQAPSKETRGVGVMGLAMVADTANAIKHVSRIATSQNTVAHDAVEALGRAMGPRGLDELHRLFMAKTVTEPRAVRALGFFVHRYDWK